MSKDVTSSALIPVGEAGGLPTGNKLVTFIEGITKEDLRGLRDEIGRRENQLKGMRKLEVVIAAALGEEEPKKTYKKAKDADPSPDRATLIAEKRKRIGVWLANRGKAANGQEIIMNCQVAPAMFGETMKCDLFQQTTNGWLLTSEGRRQFG